YGVAYRTALQAKSRLARRREAESGKAQRTQEIDNMQNVDQAALWAEIRQVLDEEVQRLPTRYRVPFVLCHLEGKTNEEAARLLKCPPGTIFSRLATAREKLRTRLTRRGIT